MIEKYIVSDDNKKILFLDGSGEIREIDNNELNLEIINLENVIEKIYSDINHIQSDISIVNANMLGATSIFTLSVIATLILFSGTVLSILNKFPLAAIMCVIGTVSCFISGVTSFKDINKCKNGRYKFKDKLNIKTDLVLKYEEKLEYLKQIVGNQENNTDKKTYVYEFDPNRAIEATYSYAEPSKINGFKRRTLTK